MIVQHMQRCPYADFDIEIRGAAPPYLVSARFDDRTAATTLALDVDDPEWNGLLAQVESLYDAPGRGLLTEIGRRLFRALMAGDVHQLWIRAGSRVGRLRIRLGAYPPRIAALPWELLHDPDRDLPLAAGAQIALVRTQTEARFVRRSRMLETTLPLRMLLVVPDDPFGRIDTPAHLRAMEQLAGALGPSMVETRTLTGRVDVLTMANAAMAYNPDVLHIVAHGLPDGLMLWQDGSETLVSGQALRIALDRAASLRFVVLVACLAGRESPQKSFAGVGPQLLQLGIPAVAAMQYELTDDDAGHFAAALYGELLSGVCPGAVDAAMGYARSVMYVRAPDSIAFGTPVLWLNSEDGRIFQAAHGAPAPRAHEAPATSDDTQPAEPPPDTNALLAWLADLEATVAHPDLPATWQFLASDWQLLATDFRDTLYQLPAATDAMAKRAELDRLREELIRLAADIRDRRRPGTESN